MEGNKLYTELLLDLLVGGVELRVELLPLVDLGWWDGNTRESTEVLEASGRGARAAGKLAISTSA